MDRLLNLGSFDAPATNYRLWANPEKEFATINVAPDVGSLNSMQRGHRVRMERLYRFVLLGTMFLHELSEVRERVNTGGCAYTGSARQKSISGARAQSGCRLDSCSLGDECTPSIEYDRFTFYGHPRS